MNKKENKNSLKKDVDNKKIVKAKKKEISEDIIKKENNEIKIIEEVKKELPKIIPKVDIIQKQETKIETSKPILNSNQSNSEVKILSKNDDFDYKNKIEALLFSAGRKIEFDFIMQTIGAKDKTLLKNALNELRKEYDDRKSSLMVSEDGNFWKIIVREKYSSIARKIVSDMELSKSVMETLAVIAWKTPILQSEVIKIRTNKAYDHIDELINSGFITKEKKGRSFILKVMQKFYDYFDVEGKEGIRDVFSKIKEAPGQKKVDEFNNLKESNSPQKTLGDLKVVNAKPDNSVKEAEEEMEKIKLGKLEVYDDKQETKDVVKDDYKEISVEKSRSNEVMPSPREDDEENEDDLKEKTKKIVKELLKEDNKDRNKEEE